MSIREVLLKLLKFASLSAELTNEKALLIWYKMCRKEIFRSIEWGSLSTELVDNYHSLFTIAEVAKLSGGKPSSEEAVNSAMKRNPTSVLHAFYKSLCDTQTGGGASQHAIIAEEIQKEGECVCSCFKSVMIGKVL